MTIVEWNELYDRCPDASPFLHPTWQTAWSEQFGSCPTRSFEVRRHGELVGLARCYEYEGRIVFAGNGLSDTLDILAVDATAANDLMDQLAGHRLDLQEIPRTSALLQRFPHEQCSVCPVLDLSRDIPRKLARNLHQQKRYRGEHCFETSQDPSLLEHLFELHASRWESQEQAGVLADPAVQRFHRRAANELLRVHVLRAQSCMIGVLYGFARAGVMHFYLSGFNPQWERYSPGSLLIEYAIEYARTQGDCYFNFLRGPEPYKYRWGAVDHPQYRIRT